MGLFWKEKKSVLYPRKYGTYACIFFVHRILFVTLYIFICDLTTAASVSFCHELFFTYSYFHCQSWSWHLSYKVKCAVPVLLTFISFKKKVNRKVDVWSKLRNGLIVHVVQDWCSYVVEGGCFLLNYWTSPSVLQSLPKDCGSILHKFFRSQKLWLPLLWKYATTLIY